MNGLKKELKRNYKALKARYTGQNCTDCFYDNFKQITKYYLTVQRAKFLTDLTHTTELCKKMCVSGVLPSTDGIINFFNNNPISTGEILHLQLCIASALISYISENEVADEAVKSLSKIPDIDFEKITENISDVDKTLSLDPTHFYSLMSDETKNTYRTAVFMSAKKQNKNEKEVALEALKKAQNENRHIGFYLNLNKNVKILPILTAEIILPVVAAAIVSKKLHCPKAFPLFLFPVTDILRILTDRFFSLTAKHEKPAHLNFSGNIPDNAKTIIAISTLIPSADKITEIKNHIKSIYLSNKNAAAICILADLKSCDTPFCKNDKESVFRMEQMINELKKETGGCFVLAVRERVFSKTQGEFVPFERKRGAIIALVKMLVENKNEFSIFTGDTDKIKNAKYMAVLDIDTSTPKGSLEKLIEIAEHPLNEPVISKKDSCVTSGYGIIMPSVKTDTSSATETYFTKIFADSFGIDAYSPETREKCMLMFGDTVFNGKGLINIKAFHSLVCNRFPEEYILSHDILEGCVLRTALADDVQFTDSIPSDATAYFKRLHRWVRGDTQNLKFATHDRGIHLSVLNKIRLFDNIRRALTPVFALCLLCMSRYFSKKHRNTAALIALLSFGGSDFFAGAISSFTDLKHNFFRQYFSQIPSFSKNCFKRGFLKTIFGVRTAFCCADAILRSLYRITVSKKNLLEWIPASDCNKSTLIANIKKSVPSMLFGAFLIKSPVFFARVAGKMFIADLPFSLLTQKKQNTSLPAPNTDEIYEINHYCRDMWNFFCDFCTEKHNYLIPDNVTASQEPSIDTRTSPTNIGLMLCTFLSARDFGFINSQILFEMLNNSFNTIEKMEKYNGNLYNWYDITTLKVIEPEFVSSVDSGNFMCCITALKEGLKEYLNENNDLSIIITKCEKLINDCDFKFFYNKTRNLISVGFDAQNSVLSECHYDLLMSESRMMSFFAVSKNKVPLKHWSALGRQRASLKFRSAACAWSGTMFEYFMPAIFLPSQESTLSYEALHYCIHCQKMFAKKRDIPYGVSESAYNAIDKDGNYQYKAHGVDFASSRPDPFNEAVISPYSSFLSVQFDPHDAIDNLNKLKQFDMYGKYGFYESCDFEASRNETTLYSPVKIYMSHHIGMSFLASANCVFDGIMQKRFMNDADMAGCSDLLKEKIDGDTKPI